MDVLRMSVAEYFEVSQKYIFVGNGSDEILAFSFMAFFEPGKPIHFPDITYSFYPVYAKVCDIPYETVPLRENFTMETEAFFGSQGGVIFTNPNAPASLYLGSQDIEAILQE